MAIGVGALAQAGTGQFLILAILLALCIGVIQLLMGIVRLGFLVNFLSYPVLTGFTTAAALTIVLSQLGHLLGIPAANGYGIEALLTNLVANVSQFNPVTLALGAGSVALMVALKRTFPRLPGPLVVVVLCTLLAWLLRLNSAGVTVVGHVEGGLPTPGFPALAWGDIANLLPLAGAMALVGFAQSITVAKTLARKRGDHIDANRELAAVGLANIGGSLSQAYPVTGGFSRSAVNARSGARTQVSNLITAALVALTLLFLLPLVHYLPIAALAAVILVAAIGLIDVGEIRYLFRVKKSEGLLLVFTVVATLGVGIIYGLLLGIAASILLFITLNTRPHSALLGRLPGTDIFRNTRDFPEAKTIEGLVVLRIDASLYFANTEFLKARLGEIREQEGAALSAIILDASAINDLDSSADTALHQIARDLKRSGIELYVAGVKGPVRRVMMRSGLYELLGADHFFFTIDAAVKRYSRTRASAAPSSTGAP
ncbi:MAG: SulP family inorganic anion transporter [Pseudomonadota bacterium]|nr:SulP family inorganic anion transporter [Pseudomonadota bacterium]